MRRGAVCSLVLVLAAFAFAACSSASTPQPASSVPFTAGKTFAESSAEVAEGRVLIAFVRDGATAAEIGHLAERIASLPEVERYAFMTKDECLEFFRERYGQDPSPGPVLPLPAGFWLLLHAADEAAAVQQALDGDPAVQQSDTPFSGVKPVQEFYSLGGRRVMAVTAREFKFETATLALLTLSSTGLIHSTPPGSCSPSVSAVVC